MATNSRTIYFGKAIIMNVGAEEITSEKALAKLPPRDHGNAMYLVYDVKTAETDERRFDVKVELSHRELAGRMLEIYREKVEGRTPSQIDVAIDALVRQGILPKGATEADIGLAIADSLCGKEVTVNVSEDMKDDGTFWPAKARFASPYQRLKGSDLAARMAAFTAGKPVEKVEPAPSATNTGIPAPDETSCDDGVPF